MNTLHFKYAVEIEKTRSITQAAENLYMAQPNLSKAIKELENSLGITIFRRTSKGVIPTDQGMKFLACAKQILMQIDNMEAIASRNNPIQCGAREILHRLSRREKPRMSALVGVSGARGHVCGAPRRRKGGPHLRGAFSALCRARTGRRRSSLRIGSS